ncbi:MAG TPA: thioredoxin family protein [Kofleriaceae bacterium]|nr:thioredoxin family protein [Kofleriaceae bacterium]
MPGRLSLSLTNALLPIHSVETLDEAMGPVVYDERLVFWETRLAAEYTLTRSLAVGAAFPYRVVDVDVANSDPATGDPITVTNVHARNETLTGVGDPSVSAHLATDAAGLHVHARIGTSLPLGRTEEDPHLLGSLGQEHEHIQLGTGTFIPFVSVEAQRGFGKVVGAAWALAHLSLYDNDHGYRAGDRYSGGLTAASGLGLRRWTFGVALEGHGETGETWQGVVHRDEGNAGRFDLMAGANVAWRPVDHLAVILDAKLPVYTYVDGPQLDYGLIVGIGIAATFDLKPRASWHGLDEKVVADAGVAAELVPVPGKITVFDLWAEWCAPCRELDDRLAAIARAHPDKLAVRKLDVVDTDSAAWERYMAPKQFDLPHVKVYGADGALLFERSAPPAELARAVEEVLR